MATGKEHLKQRLANKRVSADLGFVEMLFVHLLEQVPDQRLVAKSSDFNLLQSPDQRVISFEDHIFPAACTPLEVFFVSVSPLDQDLHFRA